MHKKIFTSAGYLAGASLIEKVGALLLIPVLTNVLTSEDYGSLMLLVTYMGFISLFFYNGLHSSIFRWFTVWDESFDKRVFEKIVFLVINSIGFLILLGLVLTHVFFYDLDSFFKLSFWVLALSFLSSLALVGYNIKSSVWIIEGRAYLNLVFMSIKTILILIGVLCFIDFYPTVYLKPAVELIVLLFVSVPIIFTYFFLYPRVGVSDLSEVKPVLRRALAYGWGVQASQVAFWVIASSDRIFLANMKDNAEVGYYSVLMIGITFMFVIVAFNNSFSAYFNRMIAENVGERSINRYLEVYLFIGFLSLLAYKCLVYFLSEYVVLFLSTKEYLGVSKYLYLTSDIMLYYFSYLLFSRYFHALNMVKTIILISFLAAVLNIILNYYFIPNLGFPGALYSSIAAYFFMALASLLIMVRKIGFSLCFRVVILFGVVVILNNFGNYILWF